LLNAEAPHQLLQQETQCKSHQDLYKLQQSTHPLNAATIPYLYCQGGNKNDAQQAPPPPGIDPTIVNWFLGAVFTAMQYNSMMGNGQHNQGGLSSHGRKHIYYSMVMENSPYWHSVAA